MGREIDPTTATGMHGGRALGFRNVFLTVAIVASILVPGWVNPVQAITVPATMARTVHRPAAARAMQRATFEFPATHVGFSWTGDEGTGVRFRAIDASGRPGAWMRASEAHDAERGDRHFSGVISVDRPSGIQWKSVLPPRARMGAVTLDYLNTEDGPTRTIEVPATASAAASAPDIITRAEWGADESLKHTSGGCTRRFFPVQQLFVHHTAGSNFDSNPEATMRSIYWYHVVRQGWCDVGYNFVIGPQGEIFEGRWARNYRPWEIHDSENGRSRAVAGAHVASYNSGSVGISLMGNFMNVAPTPAARRSLAQMLAWEADRHGLDPKGAHVYRNPETGLKRRLKFISGHRDAGQTSCPGNILYRSLDSVRKDTAREIGVGKAVSSISFVRPAKVIYGGSTTLSGTLEDENGQPLVSQPVTTYIKPYNGRWKPGPEGVTDAEGNYALSFAPTKNTKVIVLYQGDLSTWGSQSRIRTVRVAPLVTLETEGGIPDITGTTHYPRGTESVGMSGTVTPPHSSRSVTLRISRADGAGGWVPVTKTSLPLDTSGSYNYTFAVPEPETPATYRAVTWFPQDPDHVPGTSGPVMFSIDPTP